MSTNRREGLQFKVPRWGPIIDATIWTQGGHTNLHTRVPLCALAILESRVVDGIPRRGNRILCQFGWKGTPVRAPEGGPASSERPPAQKVEVPGGTG